MHFLLLQPRVLIYLTKLHQTNRALALLLLAMSVALPATPRRNVLHAHPQGLSTMPSFVPFGLDKSPSIRAARQRQRVDQAGSALGRPPFVHKQSHAPLHTPIALANVSIMDQTATAPPRLPVPHPSCKGARGPDSDGIEIIHEEHDYHHDAMEYLVACTAEVTGQLAGRECDSRPSVKRRSPYPPASVLRFPSDDEGADNSRQNKLSRIPGPSRTQNVSLKRARPAPSPTKLSVSERSAKKPKFDKRAFEREKLERQCFEERFRDKYTRAFPSFKFYFDSIDPPAKTILSNRVQQLGAVSALMSIVRT